MIKGKKRLKALISFNLATSNQMREMTFERFLNALEFYLKEDKNAIIQPKLNKIK